MSLLIIQAQAGAGKTTCAFHGAKAMARHAKVIYYTDDREGVIADRVRRNMDSLFMQIVPIREKLTKPLLEKLVSDAEASFIVFDLCRSWPGFEAYLDRLTRKYQKTIWWTAYLPRHIEQKRVWK